MKEWRKNEVKKGKKAIKQDGQRGGQPELTEGNWKTSFLFSFLSLYLKGLLADYHQDNTREVNQDIEMCLKKAYQNLFHLCILTYCWNYQESG